MNISRNIIIFQYLKTICKPIVLMFLLMILVFYSCQDVKKPEAPSNLISQDKMVDILTEVYLINASRNVNHKLIREKNIKLDSLVYEKYQVDSLQFVESNSYYSSDLKTYGDLLTQVQERLSLLQKEKDSIYKIVFKQDSIANSKKKTTKNNVQQKRKVNPGNLINESKSN